MYKIISSILVSSLALNGAFADYQTCENTKPELVFQTKLLNHQKFNITMNNELRQIPNYEKISAFVESSQFNLDKKPNIYVVFYDTLRPDIALENEEFKKFFDQNFSIENAYGSSTATWYSTFSLFHSMPAFITYESVPQKLLQDQYGSIFIKILNKLGYKQNAYGYEWKCVKSPDSGTSWDRFLTTYFGWDSKFLDKCDTDVESDKIAAENSDFETVNDLKTRLPKVITTTEGNLSFIALYNPHTPYKWEALGEPFYKDIGASESAATSDQIRNRYLNAVKAASINFQSLLDIFSTLPGNEDAIIILLSDHGEAFNFRTHGPGGHGGFPDKAQSKTLLSFQFGKHNLLNQKAANVTIASISDVFPTLFDYLNVHIPKELITGKSLISEHRDSIVIVKPNQQKPTSTIVLQNADYKAHIEITDKDFYHSKSFELVNVTDTDDKEISVDKHFCYKKSDVECAEIMQNLFPDAMNEMYPK